MSASGTILTTASGRFIDLTDPRPDDIDFHDIAEHLSKENRFNGATPGLAYCVAQHLCIGADALLAAGHAEAAGRFLLHDAPEAYLKDDTTPKKRAIATVAERRFGILAAQILASFDELTARFDAAIATAAGLAWPPPDGIDALVHDMDRRMLLTEWRDLMPVPPPFAAGDLAPLADKIIPWNRVVAARALLDRFRARLPAFGGRGER